MRLLTRSVRSIVLLAVGLAITSSPARANEHLREGFGFVANAIESALKAGEIETVLVGDFTGPPAVGSSASPGIRRILSEELTKRGIKVAKRSAPVGIQGKYRLDKYCVIFDVSIVNAKGETREDLNGTNDGTRITAGKLEYRHFAETAAAAAELIGYTGNLTYTNGEWTSKHDVESIGGESGKPTATVRASGALAPAADSPFEMEILVDGQPRSVVIEEGKPYVELKLGESFQVRVNNKAAFDVSVVFNLDGVNSFAFTDVRQTEGPHQGEPAYTQWTIPARQSLTLKGWHRTNETVDKFLVTPFGESAAATLGSVSGTGTISATIRATWSSRQKAPPGEPKAPATVGSAAPGVGIGRGGADRQVVQADKVERKYGVERAVITVRYDRPAAE